MEVAEATVRAMADRGELPVIRTSSGSRLFQPADVVACAARLAKKAARLNDRQPEQAPLDAEPRPAA
jgi:hypothetical protein